MRFSFWQLLGLTAAMILCMEMRAFHARAADELVTSPLPTIESLKFELAIGKDAVILQGADARAQLLVTGMTSDGRSRDMTHAVAYKVDAEGVIDISEGYAVPLADGQVHVRATYEDVASAEITVQVADQEANLPLNFPNQVVPIFTKFGCNGGGCHGKSGGQNGFRLSLLGFEPTEDFEYLVREGRGRRLFPAAPDQSLLLVKATGQLPHGGGARITPESYEYSILRRWIAQGMPYGQPDDPFIERIEVFPRERTLKPGEIQQLVVIAHYSDGERQDVTRMAQFEPNDLDMAEVNEHGHVSVSERAGTVAVMARFQGHVDVFNAFIPLGIPFSEDVLPPVNFVDELVFSNLRRLGLPPSPLCDDATFVRRVTLDVAGRIPTAEETHRFLADEDPEKRSRWIEELLASADYANSFANKWSALLRNRRRDDADRRGAYAMHAWIRDSLLENKPYDDFVRQILAASGGVEEHPPVVWYRAVRQTHEQAEDTAQLFLGLRLQCARCHHHPFEKWSQDDYYGMAAFFSRLARKPGDRRSEDRIFHRPGKAGATNPKHGERLLPTALGGEALDLPPEEDPRHRLVDWMSAPENPFFAPAVVNRYWKHFFNRGLIEPEDDMRVTNPPTNPELLAALSEHFIASGFDLKQLVRTICNSHAYQLSSEPNDYNAKDSQNFSRYYPRRLTAEVLLDTIDEVTACHTSFSGLPTGIRSMEIPDSSSATYFLQVFGRPEGNSACECERSNLATLAQTLHLLNSQEVQDKVTAENGTVAMLADGDSPLDQRISGLYLRVYSRQPTQEELAVARSHVTQTSSTRQGIEDLMWALLNTKEFLFNH